MSTRPRGARRGRWRQQPSDWRQEAGWCCSTDWSRPATRPAWCGCASATWRGAGASKPSPGSTAPSALRTIDTGDAFEVELPQHDFTRYITKSIFLDKRLWQTERLESYQYFTQAEFEAAFASLGLRIAHLRTLTVDYEKWRSEVEILSPGVDYPAEHILILAHNLIIVLLPMQLCCMGSNTISLFNKKLLKKCSFSHFLTITKN